MTLIPKSRLKIFNYKCTGSVQSFQNSVENSSGLQAFAADPAAAGMEAGSLAALGASVMINPATAATVAGPATFRPGLA